MWDEMGFVNKPEEDNMPVIPVSRTRLLIEVAPDIEPAEVADEVRVVAGSQYHIAPSGSVRARAAQGPAAPLTGFDELSVARRRMLEVEAVQLAASSPEIIEVLPDPDVPPDQITPDDRQRILGALRRHRAASSTFQAFITEAHF